MKTLIVPCSGIGKSFGSVSREAAYVVTEELCPGATQLEPLAVLVLGEDETRARLAASPAITIDGCKLSCAAKVVAEQGGTVEHAIQVVDVYRRHRDLKPSGIAELDEKGRQLAQALAMEVKDLIAEITGGVPRA